MPALAWLLSLPHADVQGCLPGSIVELSMTCFPVGMNFFGWTHEGIEGQLNILAIHGFWRLVVDDTGKKAIYIERFRDHQGNRAERESRSKFIFSKGVENSLGLTPEEWAKVSDIPWEQRGSSSTENPELLQHFTGATPAYIHSHSYIHTLDDPADPPVRAEKKRRPKKGTRWTTSQAIDAHRLVIGDPDYGKAKLPGPDRGGLDQLACLDLVEDLNLFWNRSANWLQGKGMTVSIGAIVRSIAYLDPSGLPRRANGSSPEPASRSARRAQDVVSNISAETIETYKREQGITDGS